jgi:hypothetical protein
VVTFGKETGLLSWLLNYLNIQSNQKIFKIGWEPENLDLTGNAFYATIKKGGEKVIECSGQLGVKVRQIAVKTLDTGKASVNVHFGTKTDPVISRFDVHINKIVQINVSLHIMNIKDRSGNSVTNLWTKNKAKALFSTINAIWLTMGIEFNVKSILEHNFTGDKAGTIRDDNNKPSAQWETKIIKKKFNQNNRLNVYLANGIEEKNTNGSISSNANGWYFIKNIYLRFNSQQFPLARTFAHEIGHALGLPASPYKHSDENSSKTFRFDIWSRSRVMGMSSEFDITSPNRKWQDTTYGRQGNYMEKGGLFTCKKLKNDGTDNELALSRKNTKKVY